MNNDELNLRPLSFDELRKLKKIFGDEANTLKVSDFNTIVELEQKLIDAVNNGIDFDTEEFDEYCKIIMRAMTAEQKSMFDFIRRYLELGISLESFKMFVIFAENGLLDKIDALENVVKKITAKRNENSTKH
ncbi:MAG: hypothetical protein AMS17_09845 [Spirochaetes bacterium DG_61]|nr:MAG: hypothetical protein AMS17_09845 [Spirochaetes bacterium DG_61]